MRMRTIVGAVVIVGASFAASLWAMDRFWPGSGSSPEVAKLPPLQPVSRATVVTAPVAISLAAIRQNLDAAAPRDLIGQSGNPVGKLLSKAEIGMNVSRGALAVTGSSDALTFSTPLTGTLSFTGKLAAEVGNISGSIAGLIGRSLGKEVQGLTDRVLDQRVDIHGQINVSSRPTLLPHWRIEPNVTAQVAISDNALSIAGIRINVASEVKPQLDRAVNEQAGRIAQLVRNDPLLENVVRREWAKMCRAIPLGGAGTGLPALWLELRPIRAAAAQPRIDASNVTLTVGVQAETRIVAQSNKPTCPFPATLDIVPSMNQGRMGIVLPIDVPFSDVSALVEAQLKGRKFPEDGSGAVQAEVRGASVTASGDRLLISLKVRVRERKSWFGFGANATAHIWGKPVLDQDKQILRLADLTLSVESQAAFGLLGAAARAAVPYLQDALAQNAVIDLKPFAADAQQKVAATLNDFRQNSGGVRVDAAIDGLRLSGIEFDSDTLRVIAEASGSVAVAVTELPKL